MGRNICLSESLSSRAKLSAIAALSPLYPQRGHKLGALLAVQTQRHILLLPGCESQKVGLPKNNDNDYHSYYSVLCKRFNLFRMGNLASEITHGV